MNTQPEKDALKLAISNMPEAPADPSFASRVLAQAAVTPQLGPVAAGATSGGFWPSFVAGVAGFCLGAMFVFAIFSVVIDKEAASEPNATAAVEGTAPTIIMYDPLEISYYEQDAGNGNGGQQR